MSDLFSFAHPNCWEALISCKRPIVLYGMGNGADKVLDELARRGVTPAGVMASAGFVRHQNYRGYTVCSQAELEAEFGDFAVAVCFGSSIPSVMDAIRAVGRTHPMLIPPVPVAGDTILDDGFLALHRDEMAEAYALLADEQSRAVFKGVLDFYYTGRLDYLARIESAKDDVFHKLLRLYDERYLDLGAYRGDTIDEFLRYTDGYRAILALEPNPKNYHKLVEHSADVDNCIVLNAAVADTTGMMTVTENAGRMAQVGTSQGAEILVTTVDALSFAPTYLKADIEGMEARMLSGAGDTLRTCPKLNIAAYHRTEDFFSLILRVHDLNPAYKIHLRKHPYIPCWDLNLYAV